MHIYIAYYTKAGTWKGPSVGSSKNYIFMYVMPTITFSSCSCVYFKIAYNILKELIETNAVDEIDKDAFILVS